MNPEKNKILEELKQLPAFLPHHTQRESHPFSLLPGGFPKGSVIEVSARRGSGKTELVLKFLAENPSLKVAWVEAELSIYPYTCASADLSRMLFVNTGAQARLDSCAQARSGASHRDPLQIAHQLLRSQVFALVVLSDIHCNEVALRRLQLGAQKSGSSVALLVATPTAERNWPIALQLKVVRERGEIKIEILRGMRGRTGE